MSKWTPGPWDSDGCYLRGANGEPDIARIYQPMGIPDEERSANARLIAAAPEMYDALKALVESPNTFSSHDKARAEELLARINGDKK